MQARNYVNAARYPWFLSRFLFTCLVARLLARGITRPYIVPSRGNMHAYVYGGETRRSVKPTTALIRRRLKGYCEAIRPVMSTWVHTLAVWAHTTLARTFLTIAVSSTRVRTRRLYIHVEPFATTYYLSFSRFYSAAQ